MTRRLNNRMSSSVLTDSAALIERLFRKAGLGESRLRPAMRVLRNRPAPSGRGAELAQEQVRRRRGHLVLISTLLACALLPSASLSAQQVRPVAPNETVRLSSPQAQGVFTVAATGPRALVLRNSTGAEVVVPLGEVEKLEVRRSRGGSALRGAGIGLLTFGVGGALLGYASGDDPPGMLSFSARENAVIGAVVFGAIGMVGGAIIGGASRAERWYPVPLRDRSVSIAPTAQGLGIRYAY
jgi:hypothetical protein